jgi:hypothetical protein
MKNKISKFWCCAQIRCAEDHVITVGINLDISLNISTSIIYFYAGVEFRRRRNFCNFFAGRTNSFGVVGPIPTLL